MEKRYIEILEKEITKLSEADSQLANLNLIEKNSLVMRKIMQKKVNDSYSLIVDVKMELEKTLKEIQEKC